MSDKQQLPEAWAAERYIRVLSGFPNWNLPMFEFEFEVRLERSVFELLPGHPARLVPPPSDQEGYAVLEVADAFRDEFDLDEEIDAGYVHRWLVRQAEQRGAR